MKTKKKPNIVLILLDDMGYSDLGCYGGEIDSPNLNSLADNGVKFSQFYNTAKCSPSRASLLTGLHPHQVGMAILANTPFIWETGPRGYTGSIGRNGVTIPEVLKTQGYHTYMSGKWHLSNHPRAQHHDWPNRRGFDHFYGNMNGATSYYNPATLFRDGVNVEHEAEEDPDFYYTDAISDQACQYINQHFIDTRKDPLFMYVSYTCPHWPLHAPEDVIAKYKGRFDAGWDKLRVERLKRLREFGLINAQWELSARYDKVKPWEDVDNKEWETRRMEVYAAQLDIMDQGVGRIIETLKAKGQFEDTLIIFLSDNGATREEIKASNYDKWLSKGAMREYSKDGKLCIPGNTKDLMPGPEHTQMSYGTGWGNMSNTPFRLFKSWVHEGGIATPLIFHWPNGLDNSGSICHELAQLPDIMATILDVTGALYPQKFDNNEIFPLEGHSLWAAASKNELDPEKMLYFEHSGNAAIRQGKWKLVRDFPKKWELYDMEADRTELHDLVGQYPEKVKTMKLAYKEWARRCFVLPRKKYLRMASVQGLKRIITGKTPLKRKKKRWTK